MKTAPRPTPTAPTMKANPIVIPAICGMERRKPWVSPDDSNMMLFGPGVKNITTANKTNAMRSDCDMLYSGYLGNGLRRFRQQQDRDAEYHDDHAEQPQRSKGLAEHHARCAGADERHQQRERHHLRGGIIAQQPAPQPVSNAGGQSAEAKHADQSRRRHM